MSSPDSIGQDQPVYLENVTALRRNVQALASTFLLLSAPQPVGTLINVPIASVTVTPFAPTEIDSNDPLPVFTAPTYVDAPTSFVRSNRWLDQFRWNLLNQPTLGPVINVPTAAVSVAPTPPNVFEGFLWVYLPSDDGWWPEPDTFYKRNAGYNFAILSASTTPTNVVINMPVVNVSLATFAPNVVASGNGATINLPAPPNVSLATFPPTVVQINNTVLSIPVAQVLLNANSPVISGFQVPPGQVSLAAYPPTVTNSSQPTIWDATYRCVNAGLTIGQDQWVTHPTIPYGYVISQSPASGTQVSPWTTVNFVVSFGPGASIQTLTVPSVVGLEAYQAEQQCVAAGMDINPRSYAYSSTVAPDYVIAQSVTAGISVYAGTPISMTVSIGPAPTTTTVTVP